MGDYMPYRPYSSDTDESDVSDVSDGSDVSGVSEDIRIRRELDPRYAIIASAGPNLNTSTEQLKYAVHTPGAEFVNDAKPLSELTYLDPPKTILTTLFCVKSSNRDTTVYPSAFNYQIKLPRVYKNVTKFQLVQLSFPYHNQSLVSQANLTSSFYNYVQYNGYNPSCISSCLNVFTSAATSANSIGLMEQGRVISGNQLYNTLQISSNLNNNQIANQLTAEANNTPPFNLITYDDFKNSFKVTKDISLLFNEPGDNYHSKLSSNMHSRHTKDTIINTYYSHHDINKHPVITDTIAFNSYYFPVLKELVATDLGFNFINTDLDSEQLKYYTLSNFLGLDSLLYYEICSTNQTVLDEFRKNHTFEYRNINKYVWAYDNNVRQFTCKHETLHTSLKCDINNSLNKFMDEELQINSFNTRTFNALKAANANNNAILNHLQSNVSTVCNSYGVFGDISNDLHNDPLFTSMFNYTSTFGRQYGSGKSFTFCNFLDYSSTLFGYSTMVQSTSNSISSIYGNAYARHHDYVSSKYTNVLPNDMIQTRSYISGQSIPTAFLSNALNVPGYLDTSNTCLSSCVSYVRAAIIRYYSCLPVNNIINTLDYKLGIHASTIFTFSNQITYLNTISSFNHDYFLQINSEQSFNNMDVSMPENYNISNETTGQTKLMYAKILTGAIGDTEISQTCIQNPILFTNTLGKLDKLSFKIYLDDINLTPMWLFYPFANQLDEWSATFQIDEEVGYANRNSGWGPTPTVPMDYSYMGLTPNNNPNNK